MSMTTQNNFSAGTAVLAQFEPGEALEPLTVSRAVGMLEVLGRPVLHHWLDALCEVGVNRVIVLAGSHPEQLRRLLDHGNRWGFDSVEFISTDALETWDEVTTRLDPATVNDAVFCSLNSFPMVPLASLAVSDDYWFGPDVVRPTQDVQAFTIQSPRDLWRLNMRLLRVVASSEVAPGSVVDPAVRLGGRCIVGERVSVPAQVRLENTVIGKDVSIGGSTNLDEALVLSDSLVGSHLSLRRVIVDGPRVVDVASGCVLEVDDPHLFSRLGRRSPVPATDRVLAAFLAAVTLPVLLFSSRERHVLHVFDGADFNGQPLDREIPVVSLAGESRFARRIPWLIEVIRGHLPLFGVRERGDTTSVAPGVISLADFCRQEPLEMALANSIQANTRTLFSNLTLAGKWLTRALTRS